MTFLQYLIKIYPLWDGKDLSELKVPVSQMINHAESWAAQTFGNVNFNSEFWQHYQMKITSPYKKSETPIKGYKVVIPFSHEVCAPIQMITQVHCLYRKGEAKEAKYFVNGEYCNGIHIMKSYEEAVKTCEHKRSLGARAEVAEFEIPTNTGYHEDEFEYACEKAIFLRYL